jgi:hypothetical protein
MVDVALRMNARPHSSTEWDEIEAEIQSIQQLAPKLWYGEYLRSKFTELRQGQRRPRPESDNVVVRGSAPDESQSPGKSTPRRFGKLFGKSNTDPPAKPQSLPVSPSPQPDSSADRADRPLNLPGTESTGETASAATGGLGKAQEPEAQSAAASKPSRPRLDADIARASDRPSSAKDAAWQEIETTNFHIFYCDARLAASVGEAAEAVRAEQAKRWGSPAMQRPWTPRCEIYLYPTGKEFAQATGQPEGSPGFSTMFSNGNRVTGRRTSLRADHPQLLKAILPHEVTHVVLADLFTVEQIPRWADEGIAVLAEPPAEQKLRAAELKEPLESGKVFNLSKLMSMDYPDAKDWSLYYAQSISLTSFLVEQGTPERFVKFVRDLHRTGVEAALRESYQISGFVELQDRWRDYARQQLAQLEQPTRAASAQPSESLVR